MSLVPPDPPLSDGVIVLRPMDERDLPAIERAASDVEIRRWFDLHTRSAADYLAAKHKGWAEGTSASFAICDATRPDTPLGHVFVERHDDGDGSVGYWLLEQARGEGRATRAVRLAASWTLAAMRLRRLQIRTDPENVASQRVAERAGFTRADGFVYSLLPHDLDTVSTMLRNRSAPPATVTPVLVYPDVRAAVAWLERAFGFQECVRIGEAHRAQLRVGVDGAIVVADVRGEQASPAAGHVTHVIKVRVPDVDEAFARACRAGARVHQAPETFEYGERSCMLDDLAGHRWELTQTVRDVAPEEWGGTSVAGW